MWLRKITNLIETRKLIALLFATVFSIMMLSGDITTQEGLPLLTMAIGYYFGGSTARDNPKKVENDEIKQ